MNREQCVEAVGALPVEGAAPLDITISAGCCCLLGSDESLTLDYLRMLAGVAPALQGEIRVMGRKPRDEEYGGAALRRQVGYVTPRAPLSSVLDGVRNVMLPALYHKAAPEGEVTTLCEELLNEMNYTGNHRLLPAFMPELQRHMLLIARALILRPRLLFLERPLLGLDSVPCDQLRDYICGPVAQRVDTLVIASNDPLLARRANLLLFVGQREIRAFDGWQSLLQSDDADVQQYLARERRYCTVLEG